MKQYNFSGNEKALKISSDPLRYYNNLLIRNRPIQSMNLQILLKNNQNIRVLFHILPKQ